MFYPIKSIPYTLAASKRVLVSLGWKRVIALWVSILCAAFGVNLFNGHDITKLTIVVILLVWISLIDLYERIIPDCLVLLLLGGLIVYKPFPNSLMSLALIAGIILMHRAIEYWLQKDLIGWGDVKLMGVCLMFLSISQVAWFFGISGATFVVAATALKKQELPFAPMLCISFLSALLLI